MEVKIPLSASGSHILTRRSPMRNEERSVLCATRTTTGTLLLQSSGVNESNSFAA
jgi:hypothetical protein